MQIILRDQFKPCTEEIYTKNSSGERERERIPYLVGRKFLEPVIRASMRHRTKGRLSHTKRPMVPGLNTATMSTTRAALQYMSFNYTHPPTQPAYNQIKVDKSSVYSSGFRVSSSRSITKIITHKVMLPMLHKQEYQHEVYRRNL